MKYVFMFVFALSMESSVFAQNDVETITIKTSIVCDHCMECDDCGYNIDTSIRKAKGIKKININPEANTVEVTYRTDKITPEDIRAALAKAGFDADEVKADPKAYAKLDDCCKKLE